ncbi:protein kinase [Lentinula edodes]|uniref:Protein kinase n=1 Tax=Lentinula edodes TaxID=5353 RepID=A0A1Q3DUQ5_LENED|nr:protein kinase [Lentinula edodes]
MKDPTTLQYPDPANDKGHPSSGRIEFKEGFSFTFPCGKKGTRTVKMGRVLFRSNGVIGRGSMVMRVTCVCESSSQCDWSGKKLVLKPSFPSKTRASEKAFMDKCKEKATDEHVWVFNHLPEIYYSFVSAQSPQAQLKEIFGDEYEMRVVRGIILEELHPLSTLKTERECAQVFYDIVQCHHWAWKYPQILHRDISGYFSYKKVVMIMHRFNQAELKTWGQEWQVTLEEASSEDWELEELEEN